MRERLRGVSGLAAGFPPHHTMACKLFVGPLMPGGVVALAEIVACGVILEDARLPFGQVTGGTLVLRGTLIPCRGMRDQRYSEDPEEYRIALPSVEQAGRLKWELGGLGGDEDDVGSIKLEHFANATIDCEADEGMGRMCRFCGSRIGYAGWSSLWRLRRTTRDMHTRRFGFGGSGHLLVPPSGYFMTGDWSTHCGIH